MALSPQFSSPPDRAMDGTGGVLTQLFLGLLCPVIMVALFWQYIDIYFVFGGPSGILTPGDEATYLWTAGVGLSAAVAGAILASVRRRPLGLMTALVLLVAVAGAAFVFAVPQGRWQPGASAYERPENQPCYSGSNDCPVG